jgi:hypothetical protein
MEVANIKSDQICQGLETLHNLSEWNLTHGNAELKPYGCMENCVWDINGDTFIFSINS